MRTIVLCGDLGARFGEIWELEVATPAEALQAIEANRPGLRNYMLQSGAQGVSYCLLADDRPLEQDQLVEPFGRETIFIVPVVTGAGSKDIINIALGAALIWATAGGATSFVVTSMGASVGVASVLGNMGIALALGGLASVLAGTPERPSTASDAPDSKQSYYFNGPANTAAQGNCVPLGYGELIVGSQVISAGVSTENI